MNNFLFSSYPKRVTSDYISCNPGSGKKIFILLLFLIGTIKKLPAQSNDVVSFVNPFIGTTTSSVLTKWGSEGGTYPGAVAPSGFIQLTPETRVSGTKSYNFIDSSIYYFSCIQHRSGFPGGSSGKLLVMPVSNGGFFEMGIYHRKFSHQEEKAEPGYYKVLFDDGILSEATASERTGMFRFTFPKGIPPKIFIGDAGEISIKSSQLLYGSNFNAVVKFDKPIVAEQKVNGGSVVQFDYSPVSLTIVNVRLSVSGVSFKSAERNIDVESASTDFDQLREKTKSKWAKELSVIEIDDSNATNKTIFYTALYHSLLLPWIISDVDGNYLGNDGKVHKATGINQYGGFSPWDTFRSLHPLLTLLYPGRQKDMVLSMLDIYKQTGYLPVESMTGNHAVPIIVDSYLKGITGFDKTLAYAAMKKSIVHPPFIQQDMQVYQTLGYIPFSLPESVTRTVEYAYDDWALANYSKQVMHNADDYKRLLRRSYSYRNLLNVPGLFLLPRNKGEFKLQPGTSGYKEGDKWVYSYFVPHNGKDLINLMGGNKAFVERLDSALTNNLIVFDNETVFHLPYLFNCANDAGKTQQWVRKIMTERFKAIPGGLPGNDDLGSMSSWYVFSTMGIYPICPGRPLYAIGSPLFNSLTMHLENGKKFTIIKSGASDENIYVKSLRLNNEVYNKLTIPHASVLKGGEIVFNMDSISNRNWQKDNDLSETTSDASFKMTGYTVSKKKVKPNELFWVFFTVKNNGSLGTKQVNLFVNGKLYGYKNCMVPPNSVVTDSMSCRLYPYGKSSVKIESLDSKIVEVIGTDSSLSASLQVSGLFVKPIIKNNEVQSISFTVQNIGGIERSFEIPVLLDDSLVQAHNVLLGPGQITALSQTIPVTKEGFHSISVNGIRED
ncbi:MAG TPA: GH92 family glycosyl hydrolase, partial [Chitinophagaceae bacterium]|nr:GH92 family glycosyl hydrolase [Chitinophagaceae bacterium]